MTRLTDITDTVYYGASRECEHREFHDPRLRGSGHHTAQDIAVAVEKRLIEIGTSNLPLLLLAVRKAALAELEGRELSPDTDSHPLLTNRSATAIVNNVKAELLERHLFTEELPAPEPLLEDVRRKIWPSIITFVLVTAGGAAALTLGVPQYIVLPVMLGSGFATYVVLARRR